MEQSRIVARHNPKQPIQLQNYGSTIISPFVNSNQPRFATRPGSDPLMTSRAQKRIVGRLIDGFVIHEQDGRRLHKPPFDLANRRCRTSRR
jgi:hypothetical protein